MTPLSKLQQEVIEKFDNFFPDGLIPTDIENVKQFILNTIEEAYKKGLKDAIDKYFLDAEKRLSITNKEKQ